jgi:hypothetical protein
MNADARTAPLAATAAELRTRIADERRRMLLEQNLQHDLHGQRLAPLEAGDDEALDRVERQIVESEDRAARIQERIEILERRLAEARAREDEQSLDDIAALAERARDLGVKLIRTRYPKLAAALAKVLSEMAANDLLLDGYNRTLVKAGRQPISKPNQVRSRRSEKVEITKTVRVGRSDARHPRHGIDQSTASMFEVNDFVDVEVTESMFVPGYQPNELWKDIALPASDVPDSFPCTRAIAEPIWTGGDAHRPTHEEIEAARAAIEKETQ